VTQGDDSKLPAGGKASVLVFIRADRVLLRQCAEALSEDLGAEPQERFDGGDQIFWDFVLGGSALTLHWHQTEGLSVASASARGADVVEHVAQHLRRRFSGANLPSQ
jgi:hypothetical protein